MDLECLLIMKNEINSSNGSGVFGWFNGSNMIRPNFKIIDKIFY